MENNQNKKGNVFGAALLGMAIGAITGVLLAPKSGKETRDDLGKVIDKMRKDITERTKSLREVSKTAYQEIVDVVVKQYEDAKHITSEQAQKLRRDLSEGYDRVKAAIEESKAHAAEDVTDMPEQK